jgi:hypothetical protein
MSNHAYSYFYAPSWDYPPRGPIKIGNVLTSMLQPERPLFAFEDLGDDEAWTTTKTQVEFSKSKLNAGKFSILTKFLHVLGIGLDATIHWDKRLVNELTNRFD